LVARQALTTEKHHDINHGDNKGTHSLSMLVVHKHPRTAMQRTSAARHKASSVSVLTLLTLLVYHRIATATEDRKKPITGATSNATCFPLTTWKR
jgi:hypothetical protein